MKTPLLPLSAIALFGFTAYSAEVNSADVAMSSARYQLYTGVSAAKNSNTVQSVSGDDLSSPQAKRFDLGLNYQVNESWNVGAVASLQAQTRSTFNEAFLTVEKAVNENLSLGLRLGARNHFIGSMGAVATSQSDLAFVGAMVPSLNYPLPAGFSLITSSLSGRSPFDGVFTGSARSSGYMFYGVPVGLAKTFGESAIQVRTGYHRLTGGGGATGNFVPVAFEGKIQLSKEFALGASYELPGNREVPNFSAATEYELYETNAMIWATTSL